jgi:2-polyprenyl-3-methyl-5-hydroxy-6-metoxy-1,4-benzoquinol methylase
MVISSAEYIMVENKQKKNSSLNLSYVGAALAKRAKFMAEQVKKQAAIRRKDMISVLDLGCGLGNIPFLLGSMGYNVLGIDLDENSIASCNDRNCFPNVRFAVGNAENMELSESFNVVIASEVIEHVQHPDMVIKTMRRHLKEEGVGIISIPNGYCLWELVVSRFIQKGKLVSWLYKSPRLHKILTGGETPFYSKNIFCFHSHFFSFGKLKKLLKETGFKLKLVRNSDLGILPEWSWLRFLKKIECKLADYVPHSLAGGWLLVIRKYE